ncbi:FecR family protein [Maribacter sp. 2304DJ31-5]|uniref:FecR family protein n=1 Tax=Maribacter sp. 2304DJ31-5 TaxID=3386273 RepID=UPI0039BD1686
MNSSHKIKQVLKHIAKIDTIDLKIVEALSQEEQELIIDLYRDNLIAEALEFIDSLDVDGDWERFRKEIAPFEEKTSAKPTWRPLLKYAAVFIGLLTAAFFLYYNAYKSENAIPPAGIPENVIVLTQDDGAVQVINTNEEQKIALKNGQVFGVQKGNKLEYVADVAVEELIYNELQVPYGKTFGITLSDGTVVHLNSGTKLRYPIKFIEGKKREVYIKDGEAFFEVTKDSSHPFVVNTGSVAVEVLGTKFNVSSFEEDADISTVLVEGAVNIYDEKRPDQSYILKPGQKGSWNRTDHKISMEEVDVRLYTGWIKGEMIFRNSSFDNMVKKLERRYNVTIQSDNEVLNSKKFNAGFHVDIETLDDVMKAINNIHPFTYTILDNQIIIE